MPGVSGFICGTIKTVPYFFVLSQPFFYLIFDFKKHQSVRF